MVRKRRTALPGEGEGEGSQEGAGRGQSSQGNVQRTGPPPQQVPTGRGESQGGGGRGPQGGPGGGRGPQQGVTQQQPGGPSESQGRGRGWGPQQGGLGGYGGGGVGGHSEGPSGGPSSPQLPKLPLATPVPRQVGTTSHTAISETCSSRVQDESQLDQEFKNLDIQKQEASALATPIPSSSKSVRFPLRPGKGSTGFKCVVKANHFCAELPHKDLHQYDVTITPEVASRSVNRAVMKQLVLLYRESHLARRLPAYDGRKSLYTAGPLPFQSQEFRITLVDEDDGSGGQRFHSLYKQKRDN